MNLNAVVVSFIANPGESLGKLVSACGYSKPVKAEMGMQTFKDTYEYSSKVEIERLGDEVYITVHLNDPKMIGKALLEVVTDLKAADLMDK